VVTGRPDQGVRRVDGAGHDRGHRRDRAPSREARYAISTSPDRSARAGVTTVGLGDRCYPRQMLRRVIDTQLLVRGDDRVDALHALRDPIQIDEVFRTADEGRTRRMGDWVGKGVRKSVPDQVKTGVVREIAIVEDKTGEPFSRHG
jgi:hypothetical protein